MYYLKSIFTLLVILLLSETTHSQSVLVVTNGGDAGTGSLRQAISEAASGDTIRFSDDIDTVYLTSGELLINKSLVVEGKNLDKSCILRSDTTLQFRIFKIAAPESIRVELTDLSIRSGRSPDGDDFNIQGQHGGGIFIPDTMHLVIMNDCNIEENSSGDGAYGTGSTTGNGGNGGGIFSNSNLQLIDCHITGNRTGTSPWAHSGGTWDSKSAGNGGSGGGIYCTNNLSLDQCNFDGNICAKGGNAAGSTYSGGGNGGQGGNGGAVCSINGLITITNTNFISNSTGKGGNASNSQQSCIAGSGGKGGALYFSGSIVLIDSTDIVYNNTGNGGGSSGNERSHGGQGGDGGGIYALNSEVYISSVMISNNYTGKGGSGCGYSLECDPGNGGNGGGLYAELCQIVLIQSRIEGNYTGKGEGVENTMFYVAPGSGHGGSGGGIYLKKPFDGSWISNSTLVNNHTGDGGTCSGAFDFSYNFYACGGNGGGLAICYSDSLFRIHNSAIRNNYCGDAVYLNELPQSNKMKMPRGGSGGGIYLAGSNHQIVNTTVSNNCAGTASIAGKFQLAAPMTADSIRGMGGGIFAADSCVFATNSIIAYNYIQGQVNYNDIEGKCKLNYCMLYTDTLAIYLGGEGNLLNTDPKFQNWPQNLSLTEYSLAINHGSPDTTGLFLPETDLAGNPRVYGDRIDMGAYEFQGEPNWQRMEPVVPDKFDVSVFPNPFINETRISYYLEKSGDVNLSVYNSSGVKVGEVKLMDQPAGINTYYWNRKSLPDGIYFMLIRSGKAASGVKLVVIS